MTGINQKDANRGDIGAAAASAVADPFLAEPWKDRKATPFIQIENVTKSYGNVVAVRNLSLNIYRNEMFSLLGGSGCGKTTLLRMLAGLETPDSGRILIDGEDMTKRPPYERPVNMMFQSYALFPHMTVGGNIAFGLKQDGLPKKEIEERVNEALALVELTPFKDRKPDQLSGGQRQRVALARALVKRPKVLLLDEPLGALDKNLRERTQFELARIQAKVGITFVIVTHDQAEAMTLSSRIAVMNSGEVAQVGTPPEIYEFPVDRYVAGFVGSVNMFEGRIAKDAPDHVVIASEEAGTTIRIDHGVSGTDDAQVFIAIRPEKMDLHRERPAGEHNATPGKIEEMAYYGTHALFQVKLDTGKTIHISRAIKEREQRREFNWDEKVWVSWPESAPVVLHS